MFRQTFVPKCIRLWHPLIKCILLVTAKPQVFPAVVKFIPIDMVYSFPALQIIQNQSVKISEFLFNDRIHIPAIPHMLPAPCVLLCLLNISRIKQKALSIGRITIHNRSVHDKGILKYSALTFPHLRCYTIGDCVNVQHGIPRLALAAIRYLYFLDTVAAHHFLVSTIAPAVPIEPPAFCMR